MKKKVIISSVLVLIFAIAVIQVLTMPIKSENIRCDYSTVFAKSTCVQQGDIVPSWLKLNDLSFLGGNTNYTMQMIIKNTDKDYRVLNMTDMVLIPDLPRKFIYEKKEQTMWDFFLLKMALTFGEISNWGSQVLYCSENNLEQEACKEMKRINK